MLRLALQPRHRRPLVAYVLCVALCTVVVVNGMRSVAATLQRHGVSGFPAAAIVPGVVVAPLAAVALGRSAVSAAGGTAAPAPQAPEAPQPPAPATGPEAQATSGTAPGGGDAPVTAAGSAAVAEDENDLAPAADSGATSADGPRGHGPRGDGPPGHATGHPGNPPGHASGGHPGNPPGQVKHGGHPGHAHGHAKDGGHPGRGNGLTKGHGHPGKGHGLAKGHGPRKGHGKVR